VHEAAPGAALGDAVHSYDRLRRPRAATVVRQTRRMSAVLQTRGRLALRARDAALGTISPRLRAARSADQWRPPA
jgi:2-polyprenyl-6-methoxyphenol hydroxylase-like FAD-dependent oxidoreductase